MRKATYSLVGDIGGTNTRVALADAGRLLPETVERFKNSKFSGFESILELYIAQKNIQINALSIAVAGPVAKDIALMTNLDWRIEVANLTRSTGAKQVFLLNDLQAQGHALGYMDDTSLQPILAPQKADQNCQGVKLVVGVGTGFNAAPVHDFGSERLVAASECGHVNLPLSNTDDYALNDFLQKNNGFVGVEEVLSGRGLEQLYSFSNPNSPHLSGAQIMGAVGQDPAADHAAELFVRFLGTVVGNLALTHLPFGGIYLCGGVARAFSPYFGPLGFEESFCNKGRFSDFMLQFPVSLITDDFAALTGSAAFLQLKS